MTRAEYLEYVQESLGFPQEASGDRQASKRILFDSQEVCDQLACAHLDYCRKVASILGLTERAPDQGGPEDRPLVGGPIEIFKSLLNLHDPYDMER